MVHKIRKALLEHVLIATFVCCLMPPAHAQHKRQVDDGQNSAEHRLRAGSPASQIFHETAKQSEIQPSEHKKPCDRPSSREEDDTCSQRRIAEAAERVLRHGDEQGEIEWWGLCVGVISAVATACAAWFSAEAARQARRSADIANKALEELERAYVFCDGVEAPGQPPEQNQPFLIKLKFINSGRTPTKHGKVYWSWYNFCDKIPCDFKFPDIGEGRPGEVFIGPNGSKLLGPIKIPQQDISSAFEGKTKIYIWAWIEYDDIFKNTSRRRTEFCVMVDFSHQSYPPLFINHPKFNGADEDCLKPVETCSPKNPTSASS